MGPAPSDSDPDDGRSAGPLDRFPGLMAPWLIPKVGWLLPVIGWTLYILIAVQNLFDAHNSGNPVNLRFFTYNLLIEDLAALLLASAIVLTIVGLNLQWQMEDQRRNRKLQDRYENLVTSAPDAILVVNRQGVCLIANRALVNLLDLDAERIIPGDIVGQPLSQLIGEQASDTLAQAAAKLKPRRAIFNLELSLETREGKVPVLVSMSLTPEGETTLMLKDMREYEETQALLSLFHNAFMHSTDAIILTDEQARILEVNRSFSTIYGYSRKEVIGRNPRIIKSEKTPQRIYEEMWLSLKQKGFWTGRLINQARDESQVPVMLSITALNDEGGRLQGYMGFAMNLTQQMILEQEMMETRLRYQNLVESTTDLIFTLDPQLKLTFANSQFADQMDYDPDGLMGTDFMDLVVPEQRSWLSKSLRHGLESHRDEGVVLDLEFSTVASDGSLRHYSAAGAVMFDEDGHVAGVGAIARNITRESELTMRLAESEARHRELLEHMQEMVYQVDSLGQLTYVNPAFVRFFGYASEAEALGSSILKLYRDPADWERLLEILLKEEAVQDFQLPLALLDDTPVVISNHSHLIQDDEGQFIGVEGSMRDVTEKIQLERKARELAQFAQLDPAPVFKLDREGLIELANPAARDMLGEDLVGRQWMSVFEGSPDPVPLVLGESDQNELVTSWETRIKDRHYHFALFPQPLEGKVYVYGMDLSERKVLEREREDLLGEVQRINEDLELEVTKRTDKLVQSEKMAALGQLVAGVAHEINNPLGFLKANLSNFTEYFEELQGFRDTVKKQRLPEEISRDLEYYGKVIEHGRNESLACQEGVDRIASITRSLRLFAHPKEEKLAPSDLNEGLKYTLVLLRPSLQDINVVLKLEDLPPVLCNPGQINQVVMNLLTNAIQALQGQGNLEVRTWTKGSRVILEVVDDGPGIDPKHLSHIFEPFFTTKSEGTGLGLSISYRLIREHQGDLEVDTELGRGTCMRLTLPIEGPSPEHQAKNSRQPSI